MQQNKTKAHVAHPCVPDIKGELPYLARRLAEVESAFYALAQDANSLRDEVNSLRAESLQSVMYHFESLREDLQRQAPFLLQKIRLIGEAAEKIPFCQKCGAVIGLDCADRLCAKCRD